VDANSVSVLTIFVPDSKTPTGRRYIPMSARVLDLLMIRCGERRDEWVFPANSAVGHLTTVGRQFRKARKAADLPKALVLIRPGMISAPASCRRQGTWPPS
jgi:integrase